MITSKALDRIAQSADAEQTGVRFQDSCNRLRATARKARKPTQQFMTVEVCKSLGSAANE